MQGSQMAGVVIILIFFFSLDAAACQNDRDCPAASRCVRTFGQLEGVCERGVGPVDEGFRRRPGVCRR